MTIDISTVINTVVNLFLLIIIGYSARRLNLIDAETSKKLSTLVIKVCQPFMLIVALLKNDYSPELLKTGILVIFIGLAAHIILAVLSYFAALGFKEPDVRKIMEFSMIFSNCSFLGFPILEAALGTRGLFYGSFYVVSFNIFMWSYGMILLGRGRSDVKIKPLKMFVNFGTTPCLIGLALYIWQLMPPQFFMEAASSLGAVCTPLTTMVIGCLLATLPLREIFLSAKVYIFCVIKLVALPLAVALIAKLCNLPPELIYLVAIMTALPTGATVAMFAELHSVKPSLAAHTVGMSSLLSVFGIPLVISITSLFA